MSTGPAADDYYRHAFPDVVEAMIRVLDEEGARLLAAYEAGRLQPPYERPDVLQERFAAGQHDPLGRARFF